MGMSKRVASLLLMIPIMLVASVDAQAGSHTKKGSYPKGKLECYVTISRTEVGFIIGVGGGSGTVDCVGKGTRRFRVGGFQIGSLGLAGSTMSGEVHGMNKPEDVEGRFTRAEASIAAIAGAGTLTLQNDQGVVMTLRGDKAGAQVNLGPGGLSITLE